MNEIRESFALIQLAQGERLFTVTLSCGLVGFAGEDNAGDLIITADKALNAAKATGRNRVVSEK